MPNAPGHILRAMTHDFAVVTTSVSLEAEAKALARRLVEQALAACVQIVPIRSVYRWDGAVVESAEQLLVCKIRAADFEAVAQAIGKDHSYAVPEILMSPITDGDADYLAWLGEAVRR